MPTGRRRGGIVVVKEGRVKSDQLLRQLLGLAASELREHNSGYHWSTPEHVVDWLERAASGAPADELETILEQCAKALEARTRLPP